MARTRARLQPVNEAEDEDFNSGENAPTVSERRSNAHSSAQKRLQLLHEDVLKMEEVEAAEGAVVYRRGKERGPAPPQSQRLSKSKTDGCEVRESLESVTLSEIAVEEMGHRSGERTTTNEGSASDRGDDSMLMPELETDSSHKTIYYESDKLAHTEQKNTVILSVSMGQELNLEHDYDFIDDYNMRISGDKHVHYQDDDITSPSPYYHPKDGRHYPPSTPRTATSSYPHDNDDITAATERAVYQPTSYRQWADGGGGVSLADRSGQKTITTVKTDDVSYMKTGSAYHSPMQRRDLSTPEQRVIIIPNEKYSGGGSNEATGSGTRTRRSLEENEVKVDPHWKVSERVLRTTIMSDDKYRHHPLSEDGDERIDRTSSTSPSYTEEEDSKPFATHDSGAPTAETTRFDTSFYNDVIATYRTTLKTGCSSEDDSSLFRELDKRGGSRMALTGASSQSSGGIGGDKDKGVSAFDRRHVVHGDSVSSLGRSELVSVMTKKEKDDKKHHEEGDLFPKKNIGPRALGQQGRLRSDDSLMREFDSRSDRLERGMTKQQSTNSVFYVNDGSTTESSDIDRYNAISLRALNIDPIDPPPPPDFADFDTMATTRSESKSVTEDTAPTAPLPPPPSKDPAGGIYRITAIRGAAPPDRPTLQMELDTPDPELGELGRSSSAQTSVLQKQYQKKRRRIACLTYITCWLVLASLLTALVILLVNSRQNSDRVQSLPKENATAAPVPSPVLPEEPTRPVAPQPQPTEAPMGRPTVQPTTVAQTVRIKEITAAVESVTDSQILADKSSGQYRAYQWILYEDSLKIPANYTGLIQRYTLASLYFATSDSEGNGWRQCGRLEENGGQIGMGGREPRVGCGRGETEVRWLSGVAECEWWNVGCTKGDNGQVVQLDLKGNKLRGTIPSEIKQLKFLFYLTLSSNSLNGPLPPTLPASLRTLSVDNNALTGSLSPTLVNSLTKLKILSLGNNFFDGPLPSVHYPTGLANLDLEGNSFDGTIPSQLFKCEKLTHVDLGVNGFTGTISSKWGELMELTTLILSDNKFTGTLPSQIFQPKLQSFSVQSNQLNGTIPMELFQSTDLTSLDLSKNQFTGGLSVQFGQLVKLEYLLLSMNRFTGLVPPEMGQLKSLKLLQMPLNELTGSVPEEVCALVPNPLKTLWSDCKPHKNQTERIQCDCCDLCFVGYTDS